MKLKNGNPEQKQQGDVLMAKVEALPKDDKLRPVGRKARGFVLAEGEVTGHAHVVEDTDVEMFEDGTGALFLKTDHEVTVRHEEHGPINLPAGIWQVNIVREYDPFREEERRVAD